MQDAIGWTMAEFMSRSGLAPHDAYPTPGNGRTFVVEGRSVTLVTEGSYGAPTVASSSTCRILLDAFHDGAGEGPATWRIRRVDWSGPCVGAY